MDKYKNLLIENRVISIALRQFLFFTYNSNELENQMKIIAAINTANLQPHFFLHVRLVS